MKKKAVSCLLILAAVMALTPRVRIGSRTLGNS